MGYSHREFLKKKELTIATKVASRDVVYCVGMKKGLIDREKGGLEDSS